MKRGGQVGAELHGQCDRDFSGQVDGIIQLETLPRIND